MTLHIILVLDSGCGESPNLSMNEEMTAGVTSSLSAGVTSLTALETASNDQQQAISSFS